MWANQPQKVYKYCLFQGLKELADTEILQEAANTELERNNLEQAQLMYTQLLKKFDNVIAPPYPVMQKKNMQQYD